LKTIGIFAWIIFLFSTLSGCRSTTTYATSIYDYSNFSARFIVDPTLQLAMPEADYYVYFYGATCSHCLAIKAEVLTTIAALQTDVVYFVEANSLENVNSATGITVTPALLFVHNGAVSALYDLPQEVLDALHTLS
jgi:hypothetical protein